MQQHSIYHLKLSWFASYINCVTTKNKVVCWERRGTARLQTQIWCNLTSSITGTMERDGDGDSTHIFHRYSVFRLTHAIILKASLDVELLGLASRAWACKHCGSIYKQFRPDSWHIYTSTTSWPSTLPTPDLKPRSLLTVVVRSGGFMLIITFPILPSHNMGSSVLTSNIPSIITKCYILIWGKHQARPFCFETENLKIYGESPANVKRTIKVKNFQLQERAFWAIVVILYVHFLKWRLKTHNI